VRAYRETKQFLAEQPTAAPAAAAVASPPLAVTSTIRPEGLRRAVFGLAEGEVVITAPVFLSAESVADLRDYLDVFMKRALREAGLVEA
jgi:hypothetical protein